MFVPDIPIVFLNGIERTQVLTLWMRVVFFSIRRRRYSPISICQFTTRGPKIDPPPGLYQLHSGIWLASEDANPKVYVVCSRSLHKS